MAHAITLRSNGFAEMAYTGEKPWHGLGQALEEGASIETWTAAAGMDFEIRRSKVRFATEIGQDGTQFAEFPERHILFRSDTKAPLSDVSSRFQIVQPCEILEFFRDLVNAAGFKLSTAGTLHGGVKLWALASMGERDRIVGNDLVNANLLLATACDGSMQTTCRNVAERVVCANTLAIAMGERGVRQVTVSHRTTFDADAVKRDMGLQLTAFHTFIQHARDMASRLVSPTEAEQFCAAMVEQPDLNEAREMRAFKKLMDLFNGSGKGSTLPGVRGTAWGLVNAVTEYADYHAQARSAANRLDSAWFGAGDDMKQRAMNRAADLLAA